MSNIIDSIRLSGVTYTLSAETSGGNNVVELTQAQYDVLDPKDPTAFYIITDAQPLDISEYWTSAQTQSAITEATSGKADTSSLATVATSGSYDDLTNKPTIPTVPTSNTAFTNDAGYITIDAISGKVDTSTYNTYTAATDTALASKQDTLVSGTNIKTINNESILGSGNIDIQGGGKAIEAGRGISVTTGETADTVSFNLEIGNLNNNNHSLALNGWIYGTGSTTNSNTESGKVYGAVFLGNYNKNNGYNYGWSESDNMFIGSNNQISNTYSNNDTPVGYNVVIGQYNNITGRLLRNSVAIGYYNSGTTSYSLTCGYYNKTSNTRETSFGSYNNSVSASTTFGDSGNTLFSVGNGTANNARHNAFEIRQNGDIYITSGGTDIKLQDNLGGGGGIDSGTVQTMIDNSLSGYVYTADNGKQDIYGSKTFIGEKRISFTQGTSTNKPGFTIYGVRDAEGNASQLGTFELNPTAITESNTTFPLLSLGHYRSGNRRASVQSYIGFRQYDYDNSAAYHLLAPLPQNAKTPFSLTTNFQNFYMPLGIKVDNSTMVKADSGGVMDISSYIGSITIDPSLDSGSTNAVANSAITTAFNSYTAKKNNLNGEVRYFYWSTPSHPFGSTIISNFSINGRCPLTQTNGTNEYIDKFSLVETSAITTSVTSSSTDAQVPSAKAVYDIVGNIETLLSQI